MPTDQIQYKSKPGNLVLSEPNKLRADKLRSEEMIINLGPQHPSTHGVLRLEVLLDGEIVREVVPHIGYLHRCFDKHARYSSRLHNPACPQKVLPGYMEGSRHAFQNNGAGIRCAAQLHGRSRRPLKPPDVIHRVSRDVAVPD